MPQVAVNTLPFWSRIVLPINLAFSQVDTPTGLRVLFTKGTKFSAFSYRKGESTVSALSGATATSRDTILVQANQPRGGERFKIHGISITKDGWPYVASPVAPGNQLTHTLFPPSSVQPAGGSIPGIFVPTVEDFRSLDALVWEIFFKYTRMDLNIDGTRRIIEFGPTPFYPGIGGPSGNNVDTTNGGTFNSNFMEIPEIINWNPAGATDSNFEVSFTFDYDAVVPTWTTPTGIDPATGNAYNPALPSSPLGRDYRAGFILNFHGVAESPISDVS